MAVLLLKIKFFLELFLRTRLAVIVALNKIRVKSGYFCLFVFGLNTFNDKIKSYTVYHVDDVNHQPVFIIILKCLDCKASVKLYNIRLEIPYVAEVGVT